MQLGTTDLAVVDEVGAKEGMSRGRGWQSFMERSDHDVRGMEELPKMERITSTGLLVMVSTAASPPARHALLACSQGTVPLQASSQPPPAATAAHPLVLVPPAVQPMLRPYARSLAAPTPHLLQSPQPCTAFWALVLDPRP